MMLDVGGTSKNVLVSETVFKESVFKESVFKESVFKESVFKEISRNKLSKYNCFLTKNNQQLNHERKR